MALQPWIPMRTDLKEDPAVLQMAEMIEHDLPIDDRIDLVVGRLHRVWSWFDSQCENGNAVGVTNVTLEGALKLPGMLQAMEKVGWIVCADDSVSIPKHERWLGKGAKKRLKNAQRVTNHRKHKCNAESVTRSSSSSSSLSNKKSRVAFKPPTSEEVSSYFDEIGGASDAGDFCDYYAAQDWKLSNGNRMKDWQAAARRWARKNKPQEIQF